MGVSDDYLDGIVGGIYAAVGERAAMAPTFERIVAAVGGTSGWINDFTPETVVPVLPGVNINPETAGPYAAHFYRNDPWPRHAFDVPAGVALRLERFVPTETFRRSELFVDLLHPTNSDILHNMSLRIDYPGRFRGVTLFRGERCDPFDAGDEAVLNALGPHLRTLFRAWDRAPAEADRIGAFVGGRAFHAGFALDAQGRIVEVNRAGAAMLGRRGMVRTGSDRRLRWASPDAGRAIDALVAACAARRLGGAATVHDAHGVAHRVTVDPWPGGDAPGSATMLVSLRDVAGLVGAQVEIAAHRFGLSPSEAALATSLLHGVTIGGHAARRGTAVETVRKQLAALFAKSGTSRQAEFVAAVFVLAP